MPIYEFFCADCNIIFNFFSARVNNSKTPPCPKCSRALCRQMSTFATIGRAREPDEAGLPDIDENQMERVLDSLTREAGNINEDDPRQMAVVMRKFTEQTGLSLSDGMEEALARMEAGEDPEKIEAEMGDILEDEDPLSMFAKKTGRAVRLIAPQRDETLYEL
ncbi:zinc ribbon domain-containing protein [Desulfobacterota bacterium M19]